MVHCVDDPSGYGASIAEIPERDDHADDKLELGAALFANWWFYRLPVWFIFHTKHSNHPDSCVAAAGPYSIIHKSAGKSTGCACSFFSYPVSPAVH